MKPVAIIQARMGSTRLPGKVMRDIAGKPMIAHVVARVAATGVPVVVAVPDGPDDGALRGCLHDNHIHCFAGSADDVLDRYYHAAVAYRADPIIRITADCPLIDPGVIRHVLATHANAPADTLITGAHIGPFGEVGVYGKSGYPDGLDVEVIRLTALRHAWANAILDHEREHVTPFLWQRGHHLGRTLKVQNTTLPHDNTKLSVDTEMDFLRVQAIYATHYNQPDAIFPASRFLEDPRHAS